MTTWRDFFVYTVFIYRINRPRGRFAALREAIKYLPW